MAGLRAPQVGQNSKKALSRLAHFINIQDIKELDTAIDSAHKINQAHSYLTGNI